MDYLNIVETESALINLSIAYPATSLLVTLPETSIEGRTVHALRIGTAGGKPTALFIGGVHAREWGSADILINFASDLLEAYHTNSGVAYGGKSYTPAEVKNIVENMNVIVFPSVNPDGKKYSQETDPMWRKNRNTSNNGGNAACTGVDINRNYDFLWDFNTLFASSSTVSASSSPCDYQVYHGPTPFSEPETRNVKWLFDNYPVQWFIDIHSYSEDILYNWGDDTNQTTDPTMNFQNAAFNNSRGIVLSGAAGEATYREYIDSSDQAVMIALGNSMKDAIFAVRAKSYANMQSIGLYPVSGASDDYAYSRHILDPSKIKILSYTIEWGAAPEFHPDWSEMQNIIPDISSALMAFCKEAPCPAGLVTVSLKNSSIEFTDIPEGETTVRAASFKVFSCGTVSFSVINGPAVTAGVGSFILPVSLIPLPASGDYYLQQQYYVWVGYTGTHDGDTAIGTITIQCNETTEQWVIPIHANTIHRPTVAVELVLDKSNSMNFNSGFTLPYLNTRIKVLHYSALPLTDVIQETNALGVCAFDQNANPVMPVTQAGPLTFGAGRNAAKTAILNHQPNPMGNTAIGDGVVQGMNDLGSPSAAGYDIKAMIVLTDGFDTDHLAVTEVTGMLNNTHVFAIGLGTGDDIKPSALDTLTNSTGGYLLLTGAMNNDDQFLISKYYLQILAGITNTDIVTDPEGVLYWGDEHVIPFQLNEADISSDIVLLTPAPGLIEFWLKAPNGNIIQPSMSGTVAGVQFAMGINSSYYRVSLPVPIGAAGAGAGQWQAILRMNKRNKYPYGTNEQTYFGSTGTSLKSIPYSLNVYSYSNLKLIARTYQNSFEPGGEVTIRAILTQYGLPLEKVSAVNAVITNPDQTKYSFDLKQTGTGIFESSFKALMPGVYRIHIVANGRTLRGLVFSREKLLTASVYRGGDKPIVLPSDTNHRQTWCEFLKCLIEKKVITEEFVKRIEQQGINWKALEKCCGKH